MFKYYDESTRKERKAIANELKALYNGILEDERETFATLYHSKRKTPTQKQAYFEAVQRVGTIQAVFEILHIDYECGQPFAEVLPE
jgi:hypothetical protein